MVPRGPVRLCCLLAGSARLFQGEFPGCGGIWAFQVLGGGERGYDHGLCWEARSSCSERAAVWAGAGGLEARVGLCGDMKLPGWGPLRNRARRRRGRAAGCGRLRCVHSSASPWRGRRAERVRGSGDAGPALPPADSLLLGFPAPGWAGGNLRAHLAASRPGCRDRRWPFTMEGAGGFRSFASFGGGRRAVEFCMPVRPLCQPPAHACCLPADRMNHADAWLQKSRGDPGERGPGVFWLSLGSCVANTERWDAPVVAGPTCRNGSNRFRLSQGHHGTSASAPRAPGAPRLSGVNEGLAGSSLLAVWAPLLRFSSASVVGNVAWW